MKKCESLAGTCNLYCHMTSICLWGYGPTLWSRKHSSQNKPFYVELWCYQCQILLEIFSLLYFHHFSPKQLSFSCKKKGRFYLLIVYSFIFLLSLSGVLNYTWCGRFYLWYKAPGIPLSKNCPCLICSVVVPEESVVSV